MNEVEVTVLIHGFCRDETDMASLATFLRERRHRVVALSLPLTHCRVNEAVAVAVEQIEALQASALHFVGHSTGGIVIQELLQREAIRQRTKRVVFIATPHRGSELASIVVRWNKWYAQQYTTIHDLTVEERTRKTYPLFDGIDYRSVIGTKPDSLAKWFISGTNDGRVSVDSATVPNVPVHYVPFGHQTIHHARPVCEGVYHFLTKGRWTDERDVVAY